MNPAYTTTSIATHQLHTSLPSRYDHDPLVRPLAFLHMRDGSFHARSAPPPSRGKHAFHARRHPAPATGPSCHWRAPRTRKRTELSCVSLCAHRILCILMEAGRGSGPIITLAASMPHRVPQIRRQSLATPSVKPTHFAHHTSKDSPPSTHKPNKKQQPAQGCGGGGGRKGECFGFRNILLGDIAPNPRISLRETPFDSRLTELPQVRHMLPKARTHRQHTSSGGGHGSCLPPSSVYSMRGASSISPFHPLHGYPVTSQSRPVPMGARSGA